MNNHIKDQFTCKRELNKDNKKDTLIDLVPSNIEIVHLQEY